MHLKRFCSSKKDCNTIGLSPYTYPYVPSCISADGLILLRTFFTRSRVLAESSTAVHCQLFVIAISTNWRRKNLLSILLNPVRPDP